MSTHRDERTIATHQRWAARGMGILSIALAIDLLVRVLLLRQEPRQYLDIWLIWMATILYVAIGVSASGVAPFAGKWVSMALGIMVAVAATNTAVLTLMGMVHTGVDLISAIAGGIIGGGAGAFLLLMMLRGIYGRWERVTLGGAPREG